MHPVGCTRSFLFPMSQVGQKAEWVGEIVAQVLPQLPSKLRAVVELYPDAEMKRLLKRELKAFETRFLRVDHDSLDWDDVAVVRHETALAKVPLVAQYATELPDGGVRKIVIFAHHRDVVARLQDGLKRFRPVILVGGMGPQARQDSIDAFQDDFSVQVFIENIQAAGTGITLAPASSVCLFAELSWVPAEISQCEDRLHRIGTLDSVTVPASCSRGLSRCDHAEGPDQKAADPGCCFARPCMRCLTKLSILNQRQVLNQKQKGGDQND